MKTIGITSFAAVALSLVSLVACASRNSQFPDPLARLSMLTDQYPGDEGISRDPAVVFAEDFDQAPLTQILGRFTNLKRPASFSLIDDHPPESSGHHALRIVSVGQESVGGTLYKRLSKNYDRLFLRYYIKYLTESSYHHTAAWIGGYHPPTDWPQGHAGLRPRGDDRFTVGAEPVDPSGRFDFYNYWMGMHGGPTDYWGNFLIHDPSLTIQRDRWMCVEVMVQMNDPVTASNGELALWIDGKMVSHLGPGYPAGTWRGGIFTSNGIGDPFEGFQWRSDPALALNWFWLQHYSTRDPPGRVSSVLYDHVVLATRHVGCLSAATSRPAAAGM